MKRLTTRTFVDQCLCGRNNLTQAKIHRALDAMRLDGWQGSYCPTPQDGDRVLIFVRKDHPLAPLLKALEGRDVLGISIAELQRLLARTVRRERVDLRSTYARDILNRHGLILNRFEGEEVYLSSSSPELARHINLPRYSKPRKGFKIPTLIRDVLGLANEPKRASRKARYAAAILLDEFGINASDLMDAEKRCKLIPNWRIDEIEFPDDNPPSLGEEKRYA